MSAVDELLRMASDYRKAGLRALENGRAFGYDASDEALDANKVAKHLEIAAHEIEQLEPAAQQDYLHSMKAALALRNGDVTPIEEEERDEP